MNNSNDTVCAGKGYIADRDKLRDFFGTTLQYDVFCDDEKYMNVTRNQLLETLRDVQKNISDRGQKSKKPYDRFVLVVLTHGTQVK